MIDADFRFADKAEARRRMFEVTDMFRNWNYAPADSDEYRQWLDKIDQFLAQVPAPAGT